MKILKGGWLCTHRTMVSALPVVSHRETGRPSYRCHYYIKDGRTRPNNRKMANWLISITKKTFPADLMKSILKKSHSFLEKPKDFQSSELYHKREKLTETTFV